MLQRDVDGKRRGAIDPLLAAVLIVALGGRLAVLIGLRRTVYGDFLFPDEITYHAWAAALVGGKPFDLPDQSAVFADLVALAYRLFGADPLVARVTNVALGSLVCVPVYFTGRALGGRAAGVAAAACAAVYPPHVLLSATVLKEPLGVLLFATMLWLLVSTLEDDLPSWPRLAALGCVTALAVESRQNAIVAVPLAAVLVALHVLRRSTARRAAGSVAVVLAAWALASAPLVLARRQGAGGLAPTPVGGFNLALGNSLSSATPYYRPLPFITAVPQHHAFQFTIEASRRVGHRLTPGEASRYWTGEVVRSAREQPGAFARRLGLKLLAALNRWEDADNHSPEFLRAFVPFLRLPLPGFGTVLPLGMAGLAVLALADRRARALGALLALYVATMVAVFTNMRIRLPMVFILIPCAAAAVVRVVERRDRRGAAVFAAVALAFAGIASIAVPGAGDLTGALNTHAYALSLHGRTEEARAWWRRSAALEGAFSDYAVQSLATLALREGDPAGARALLDRLSDDSFAAAFTHHFKADAWMASREPARAIDELERSIAINGNDPVTRTKLVELLEWTGSPRAAEERRTLEWVRSFYGP